MNHWLANRSRIGVHLGAGVLWAAALALGCAGPDEPTSADEWSPAGGHESVHERYERLGFHCSGDVCEGTSEPAEPAIFTPRRRPAASGVEDGVETSRQALTTNEITILQDPGLHMSEPAAHTFRNNSGVYQTVWFANLQSTATPPGLANNRWDYGCKRADQSQWCDFGVNWSEVGWDPSLTAQDTPNKRAMYSMRMWNNDGGNSEGVKISRSTEPCPSNCVWQSWPSCNISFPGVDLPRAVFANNDNVWWTYNDFSDKPHVARFNFPSGSCGAVTFFTSPCNQTTGQTLYNFDAAVGPDLKLHIVWWNANLQAVQTDSFNIATQTWSCQTRTIGAASRPDLLSCPGSSARRTFGDVGQGLEAVIMPSIAVDKSNHDIVVAFTHSQDDIRSNLNIYRSTDQGLSWSLRVVTAYENVVPVVRFAKAGDQFVPGKFVVHTVAATGISTNSPFAQANWVSTDGGASWGGAWFSSARQHPALLSSNCYWGHYQGLAAHSDGSFFYAWAQPANGSSGNWVLKGRFLD